MDPNATYDELISLCEKWEEWGTLEIDPLAAMDQVSVLFLALNDWLTNGGFRPDAWR